MGTSGLLCVPHTTRARMNCDCRSASFPFAMRAFTRTVCVVLSTCGEIKLTRDCASTLPSLSTTCTGRFIFSCRRSLDRNIHVSFKTARLVDRGQQRRCRHSVAHVHRNISHDAAALRDHFVVMELHLLLAHLRIECIHLGLSRVDGGFRLIEILLADHAAPTSPW